MSKILVKQNIVQKLQELKSQSIFYFFIDLNKIPTKSLNSLRQEIKKNGGKLIVSKRTLLQKAGLLPPKSKFSSPIAVVFVNEDDNKILTIINQFQEKNASEKLANYIFGFYNQKQLSAEFLKELGSLPTKKDLIVKIVFSLKYLLTRLVIILNSPILRFLILINKIYSSKTNKS